MPFFHVITLFPEFFASPLACGLLGKALASGLTKIDFVNPRDFSENKHKHVDDAPYGGGPGMVIQAGPVCDAARSLKKPGRILLMSPAGQPLTGNLARELAQEDDITLICGRYEGIDARLQEILPISEISVGEAILSGGETAALAVIEAVSRFIPGFLGKEESLRDESLAANLLEYPQYTRPEIFEGKKVPATLLSGNHAAIARWRRQKALEKTLSARPALLDRANLDKNDAEFLKTLSHARAGRNLSFCLLHYPVKLGDGRIGASSLTNLDIHDIGRISRSYGMGAFYALTPLEEQLELLRAIASHWLNGRDSDRARALSLVLPVASFNEMLALERERHGIEPFCVAASARWPEKAQKALTAAETLALCRERPVVICLGTARGLAREALARCQAILRPLRFLSDNHLSVRGAAAIIADRILGDYE